MIKTIGIVGTGAVGGYYGCRILEAGHRVKFLLRGDFQEVRKRGFEVRSVDGDFGIESPEVYPSATEMGPVDLVIVAWKATANPFAEKVIRPLLHEESKILTLQNGLGNVEHLEGLFGRGRVLGGLCFVCINRLGQGVISHTGGGMITVGESEETGVLDEVVSLFGEKVNSKAVDNLSLAQWRKLVWNVPFNGLCVAEGGIDTEDLLGRPGMEEEVRGLMLEVIAGAKALGYEIPRDFADQQIEVTRPMGKYKPSSMIDFVEGREIEVEAIWGEPVRRARAAGAEVPRMQDLYERILVANDEKSCR